MKIVPLICLVFFAISLKAQEVLPAKNVEAILYTGNNHSKTLIVGLGGSEGGNAWSSDFWKTTREQFIAKGYAFVAVGYFGCKNTPKLLDKIAIEEVMQAILSAAKHPNVKATKIIVIGGSRGADLALLLASYYPEINGVVGIVASHAVFPGHTSEFNSSCWTFKGKELPYVPVNEASVPYLMQRDLKGAFEAMLQDTVAEQKALIPVEKIHGPLLLLSATQDEICPSTKMAEKMILRLEQHNFKYSYKHFPIEGKHTAPLQNFNLVFDFLEQNF